MREALPSPQDEDCANAGKRARHPALRFAGARPVANSTSCRAAARASSAARLRAWRVPGVAIWPAPHRAQRPASRSVRQAGLVHAQREGTRARAPRTREIAAACFSRHRRPDRIRVRDGSPSGSTRWAFDSGSTRSATARPRAAGTRPGPQRPGISDTTASIGRPPFGARWGCAAMPCTRCSCRNRGACGPEYPFVHSHDENTFYL